MHEFIQNPSFRKGLHDLYNAKATEKYNFFNSFYFSLCFYIESFIEKFRKDLH